MPKNPLSSDLDHVLNHTQQLWKELRGARVFITGGTGFVGSWLLESLSWANLKYDLNLKLVVLTRDLDSFKNKAPHLVADTAIRYHFGDVRDFTYPEGEFSHIIHAAAEVSSNLNTTDPLLILNTIVEGTQRVLDFAVSCNARAILFTSSGAVYGRQPVEISHIPETYNGGPDPLDKSSAYGLGKKAAEHMCMLYSDKYGMDVSIARGFTFVGPYLPLDIHYAIGNFLRDGSNGKSIVVKGDGTSLRSYLYAADLAIWLWSIFLRGKSCRPYNVGSDQAISIKDLAQLVSEKFNYDFKIQGKRKEVTAKNPEQYIPSVDRAKKELDLDICINLDNAIDRTIANL
ncbi:MAG: NAD(P)-dependent oxidoreductase [Candidatus Poseidoniia archaeon]|jgi:dTDP-glucose 4,6-dehydratase|nr:NAD(P)-dependent oxidoreductase [Candidatus Poseidoniia archaeon]